MQNRASSPRVPLPAELGAAPFSLRDGADAGLGRQRMLGRDLSRPFAGARIRNSGDEPTLLQRCAAYQARSPPGHVFSHATAALLWGVPLPAVLEERAELDVSALHPSAMPRARGVLGHRLADPHLRVVTLDQLRVCDPASTWFQLAAQVEHDDLVAAGDYFVLVPANPASRGRRPFVALDELRRRATTRTGTGSRLARRAALAVRDGAESRRETMLRLLMLRHGLPEPRLNQNVFDADGRWLGRADMLYAAQNAIVEYNGDLHRTDFDQFEKDAVRIESFRLAGYTVVEVRKKGLQSQQPQTIARIRRALGVPDPRAVSKSRAQ